MFWGALMSLTYVMKHKQLHHFPATHMHAHINSEEARYLILTKFRVYLISRKVKRRISRVLNFAILRGN